MCRGGSAEMMQNMGAGSDILHRKVERVEVVSCFLYVDCRIADEKFQLVDLEVWEQLSIIIIMHRTGNCCAVLLLQTRHL